MATMSTPIRELSKSQIPSNAEPPQDPEILNVLNEMEEEMAAVNNTRPQQHVPSVVHHIPQQIPIQYAPQQVKKVQSLYQPELAIRSAIIAVVAMIIFYPMTLQIIYSKLPKFTEYFDTYDILIRTVIFAFVVYGIFWKFNI